MGVTNCLNFCEILPYLLKKHTESKKVYELAMKLAKFESCERLYLGTAFCGKYFLGQSNEVLNDMLTLCKENDIQITLEVPTFSEGDLEKGKRRVAAILEAGGDRIDEITANDYGMLPYIKEEYMDNGCTKQLNIGRLFMKDYRDPRYAEYFQIPWKPKMFTDFFMNMLYNYHIKSCEFDMTHQSMDFSEMPDGIEAALHVPFCYQTVGRICEFASIQKLINEKFRANADCQSNCSENLVKYTVSDGDIEYTQFGRTVYFRHPGYEIKGLNNYRIIYFPLDL